MRTRSRATALVALALIGATVPGTAIAANFDNKTLTGVYASTFSSTSGSTDRVGAYVVDTASDSRAPGVDFIRNSGASGSVVAWGGNTSRAYSATATNNKVVALRPFKTDNNPVTKDSQGSWTYNNG